MGRSSEKEYRKKRTWLATTRGTCNMEKQSICTNKWRNSRTNDRNSSLLGTSGNRQNIGTNDMELLVARNEERHPKICSKLQHMSNSQTRLTGESGSSPPERNTWRPLANNLYRHDGVVARIKGIRHHFGSSGSVHEEIILPSYQLDGYVRRNSNTVSR